MSQATAVVLESDQARRDDIRIRLAHCGVLTICFKDLWICLENIHHIQPAFAVVQPDRREAAVRFITIAKAIQPALPIIVYSNQTEVENFVRHSWLLNLFFLAFPANDQSFQGAIASMAGWSKDADRPVLISGSPESRKRIETLIRFGLFDDPVLIQGESGVGKRLMVKAIHSCATGGNQDLVQIRVGDITGQWIRQMRERIDAAYAGDGNVFLCVIENIDGLSIDLQSQLLLLMEKPSAGTSIRRGRGVRFITLAERDVEWLSHEGHFRKDLYHRISVLKMTVPPLRNRQEDVLALADFFAAKYSIRKRGVLFRLPAKVRTVFSRYHWPGNVAELERTVKLLLARDERHWVENLPAWYGHATGVREHQRTVSPADVNEDIRRFLKNNRDLSLKKARQRYVMQVESRFLKAALSRTNGNCKKAAGLLNISYKSMLNKAKAYNLS